MKIARTLLLEYIGLRVKVLRAPGREREGIEGKVIDETKNTFLIEKEDGRVVKIPKAGTLFRFVDAKGNSFDVDGSRILYRSEERAKKLV